MEEALGFPYRPLLNDEASNNTEYCNYFLLLYSPVLSFCCWNSPLFAFWVPVANVIDLHNWLISQAEFLNEFQLFVFIFAFIAGCSNYVNQMLLLNNKRLPKCQNKLNYLFWFALKLKKISGADSQISNTNWRTVDYVRLSRLSAQLQQGLFMNVSPQLVFL